MTARWWRSPVLHFSVIGFALFGVRALRAPAANEAPPQRAPIVLSAQHIAALRADFTQRFHKAPSTEQLSALLEQTLEDELLYREARALALDFEDASVKRRLLEKMRALNEHDGRPAEALLREARALGLDDDVVIRRLLVEKMRIVLARDATAAAPNEAELQAYLDRHRPEFERPAALSFSHVFLSERVHGAQLARDAQTALTKLEAQPLTVSSELSDAFPLGLELRAYTYTRVLARLGKAFADQVFALEPGVWSGPIASPYGLHLVRVEAKSAPRLPSLTAVREQVVQGVLTERASAQLARGIAQLRTLYEIRVEGRDDLSTLTGGLAAGPRP